MEKYLSSESRKILTDIISTVKNSEEYQKCLLLKQKINNDKELKILISRVKEMQKKYVRSNYDEEIKKELDRITVLLDSNKTFIEYNYYLDKVNQKIDLVRDSINNYFTELVNNFK